MLQEFLALKNPFYACLSIEEKKKFEGRVTDFIKNKTFVGRDDLIVTDEMKILLAATAVQLTFGLSNYKLSSLSTINIFPDIFYSPLFKASFKGLTSRNGVLSLSWRHYERGYAIENDHLNLGLHEFAHALVIDLHDKNKFNNSFSNYLNIWKRVATPTFLQVKTGRNTFFRSYGGSSLQEFFAVCVEYFFEIPEEFALQYPLLYGHTALLLNLDMCNAANSFKLKDGYNYINVSAGGPKLIAGSTQTNFDKQQSFEGSKFDWFVRTKGLYIAMAMTVLGFMGIPMLFWFASFTVIGVGTTLILLFLCGALGLLQWKYVKDNIDMAYHQYAMFAFVGFGITLLNLLLLLNSSIIVKEYAGEYDVTMGGYYLPYTIVGEESNSALDRNLNNYIGEHKDEAIGATHVKINFETGLLGFDMIKQCTFK